MIKIVKRIWTTSKQALKCLEEYHNIIRLSSIILLFENDLGTSLWYAIFNKDDYNINFCNSMIY